MVIPLNGIRQEGTFQHIAVVGNGHNVIACTLDSDVKDGTLIIQPFESLFARHAGGYKGCEFNAFRCEVHAQKHSQNHRRV